MNGDMKRPAERIFHGCVLLLGAVIALNIAVAYLRSVLPWIIGGFIVATIIWIVIGLARWRRSRW